MVFRPSFALRSSTVMCGCAASVVVGDGLEGREDDGGVVGGLKDGRCGARTERLGLRDAPK
jgi:hypothetical protein